LRPVRRLVLDQPLQVAPRHVEAGLEHYVAQGHRARPGDVVGVQRDVVVLRPGEAHVRAGGLRVHDPDAGFRPGGRLLRHHLSGNRGGRERAARWRALWHGLGHDDQPPDGADRDDEQPEGDQGRARPRPRSHSHHARPSTPASKVAMQAPSAVSARRDKAMPTAKHGQRTGGSLDADEVGRSGVM
jgi:hypothetical protein